MPESRDLRIKTRRRRLWIAAIFCIVFMVGNMLVRSEKLTLDTFVKKVYVYKDKRIKIEWNFGER